MANALVPKLIRLAPLLQDGKAGHFGVTSLSNSENLSYHCHDFCEIFWISAGRLQHVYDGKQYELAQGDCLTMRPENAHRFTGLGQQAAVINNLAFDAELVLGAEAGLLAAEGRWFAPQREPRLTRLSSDAMALLQALLSRFVRSGHQALGLHACLHQLKALVTSAGLHEQMAVPTWLQELHRLMQDRQHLHAGIACMPRLVGRSAEHISRQWRRYFHETPGAFVNRLRIEWACELLLQSNADPLSIAHTVGFEDLSYFYRRFKQQLGCPPQRYRRQQRDVFG